jgi:hypothetical protein
MQSKKLSFANQARDNCHVSHVGINLSNITALTRHDIYRSCRAENVCSLRWPTKLNVVASEFVIRVAITFLVVYRWNIFTASESQISSLKARMEERQFFNMKLLQHLYQLVKLKY